MVVTRRDDAGLTLTELVVVLALLGVVLGAIFMTIQVLSGSAASTTANSAGTNDMSYTMGLLSKNIMGGRVLYAADQRIVFASTTRDGGHEVHAIYATPSASPTGTAGRLVWERWSTDASATAPLTGGEHTTWVMSEVNANAASSPEIPLFAYYKDAADSSLLSATPPDKATEPDTSVAAFCGTLPGGYSVTAIGRVRLRVAAWFSEGVRDNSRDIVLRVR